MNKNKFSKTKTSKKCPICEEWLFLMKAVKGLPDNQLPTIKNKKYREFYECPHCGNRQPPSNGRSRKAFML